MSTVTTMVRHKPLMTMPQVLLMNLGFFGIQYSFGMQQTAVNPIYTFLGANPDQLPILNLAGPLTGLIVQPLIGALSDKTWSPRWGRRKPYFIVGAIGCSVGLALFPMVSAVWMAVLLLWLLDVSNNTAMEPYRAFIADRLPPSQLGKGFLAQSFFTGLGITVANVCLFVFQSLIAGGTAAGIPYWVLITFWVGAICSIGTVLVSVISTKELPPTAEELAEMRAKKSNPFKDIGVAIVEMPVQLRKLAVVYLFQWFGMSVYWQFVTLSVNEAAFGNGGPKSAGYAHAVAWTGLVNGWYNIVTFCVAFLLVGFARKRGAKNVHTFCLLLACAGLIVFPHVHNQYLMLIPIIGLGIAWASIMGVPYILAVRIVPSSRLGVYMGIINMMIVIPMLIENVSFGAIYTWIGGTPGAAITFAGILLGIAALAMQWIKEPPIVRDVDAMLAIPVSEAAR